MRTAFVCLALLFSTVAARAEPADTLRELSQKLGGCLGRFQLNSGSQATVSFMMRRDGSIIGTPRVTYSKLSEDQAAREADAKQIADAFRQCLPAQITDALGGAIAGRMFTFSFGLHRPRDL